MDKHMQGAARSLGEQLAEMIEAHALDPALGRVWAALAVGGQAQDAATIAAFLDEDAAEVEALLERLVELGAAHREGPQVRAEADPLRIAARFIRAQELPLLNQLEEALAYARDRLDKSSDAQAARARAQVDELLRQVRLSSRLLRAVAASEGLQLDRLLGALGG